jgi:hypothetical protein
VVWSKIHRWYGGGVGWGVWRGGGVVNTISSSAFPPVQTTIKNSYLHTSPPTGRLRQAKLNSSLRFNPTPVPQVIYLRT